MPCFSKGYQETEKLFLLGQAAQGERSGPSLPFSKKRPPFISLAAGKKGKPFRLFKVLFTNACEGNCFYCANRQARDFPRVTFQPVELAFLFMAYYRQNLVDGLFLSSAVSSRPDVEAEKMLATVWLLRKHYHYKGYIHYKVLPGVSLSLITEAAKLAQRLSLNLEAPGEEYLSRLSPTKSYTRVLFPTLEKVLTVEQKIRLPGGVTTQFVVGTAGENDAQLLSLAADLYRCYRLRRVYYSAFVPVPGTPFEAKPPCPPRRELRLYQADALLRDYGFQPTELPFNKEGFLPLDADPKLVWARQNPSFFPVRINKASWEELIRVPGIGRVSAQKIITRRREGKITSWEHLKGLRISLTRVRDFAVL